MNNIIILDVETTQNSQTRNEEIIEIAAFKIDKDFSIIEKFHSFVKPTCNLTYITKLKTGLNDKILKDKPDINEVLPLVLKFIEDSKVIAHNANFDYKAIKNSCNINNYQLKNVEFIDSIPLIKKLFPGEKYGLNSLKLKFNIKNRSHRSMDDISSLREILILSNNLYLKEFRTSIMDELNKLKII